MPSYELVLQFRGRQVETEDEVVAIEDVLVELLPATDTLDDHEVGTGARNIFVTTSDPQATFTHIAPFLARAALLDHVTAAFRVPTGDAYTVIWPENTAAFARA